MFKELSLLKVIIAFVLVASLATAQDFDKIKIEKIEITPNISMLTGMGGNIGISVGEDGVFMIDDQFAPLADKIKEAIGGDSFQMVNFLINTHWHGDHVNGNETWQNNGSIIVAHKNVREAMTKKQFVKFFNSKIDIYPADALPIVTFTDEISFYYNGDKIDIQHYPHAHTNSDATVHFTNSNVLHMGDIYFSGMFPFVDVPNGGSVTGVISAIEKILPTINDSTKIIPGHGNLSNKAELSDQLAMMKTIVTSVQEMIDNKKSMDEIIASKPAKDFAEQWGKSFINDDQFVEMVYASLMK